MIRSKSFLSHLGLVITDSTYAVLDSDIFSQHLEAEMRPCFKTTFRKVFSFKTIEKHILAKAAAN